MLLCGPRHDRPDLRRREDKMNEADIMRQAIAQAKLGVKKGQTPFGACIVRDGQIVAAAHNNVWSAKDITAHAEIVAIRAACQKLATVDLTGCEIYSTCEPCPMCFAAIHWARISRSVFGARIADAAEAGFNEMPIANKKMKSLGKSGVKIVADFLRDECVALFELWSARPDSRAY